MADEEIKLPFAVPPGVRATKDHHARGTLISVRLKKKVIEAMDAAAGRLPCGTCSGLGSRGLIGGKKCPSCLGSGRMSRNAWITAAITEKLAR